LLEVALQAIEATGTTIVENDEGLLVTSTGAHIQPVSVTTEPFPGFPTDLQAQFMALMVKAEGQSQVTETIFENRFMHVSELVRFGAKIGLDGIHANVSGVTTLKGAPVMATDLRASASLVIAALVAEGESTIHRVYHLDRGFEQLEEKLSACGANIERVRG
jgi:UDP-N-acetylglucosamine 1-carboxyvinyltransferase